MSNADNLFEVEDNGTFKAVIIRMKTLRTKSLTDASQPTFQFTPL
jgi:hypothetical protein